MTLKVIPSLRIQNFVLIKEVRKNLQMRKAYTFCHERPSLHRLQTKLVNILKLFYDVARTRSIPDVS